VRHRHARAFDNNAQKKNTFESKQIVLRVKSKSYLTELNDTFHLTWRRDEHEGLRRTVVRPYQRMLPLEVVATSSGVFVVEVRECRKDEG
jgi:hypothetical protein